MNMLEVIVEGAPSPAGDKAARHRSPQLPLACPFCGSDPPLAAEIAGRFIVGCESDDCHVNPQVSGSNPGEAWTRRNKRPDGRAAGAAPDRPI